SGASGVRPCRSGGRAWGEASLMSSRATRCRVPWRRRQAPEGPGQRSRAPASHGSRGRGGAACISTMQRLALIDGVGRGPRLTPLPYGAHMVHMAVTIRWADGEMQAVMAAINEGAVPALDSDVAAAVRAADPPRDGAIWVIRMEYGDGQRLKAWCDARRERATEQGPNETWTRIVARVNEAIQPFAPAKEPSGPAT